MKVTLPQSFQAMWTLCWAATSQRPLLQPPTGRVHRRGHTQAVTWLGSHEATLAPFLWQTLPSPPTGWSLTSQRAPFLPGGAVTPRPSGRGLTPRARPARRATPPRPVPARAPPSARGRAAAGDGGPGGGPPGDPGAGSAAGLPRLRAPLGLPAGAQPAQLLQRHGRGRAPGVRGSRGGAGGVAPGPGPSSEPRARPQRCPRAPGARACPGLESAGPEGAVGPQGGGGRGSRRPQHVRRLRSGIRESLLGLVLPPGAEPGPVT